MAVIISEDPGFIFTHIPTTGGSSLTEAIGQIKHLCKGLKIYSGHRYLRNLLGNRNPDDYLKFTIVRNPFDRFVSHWLIKRPDLTFQEFTDAVVDRQIPWLALRAQSRWISTIPRNGKSKLLIDLPLRYERYEDSITRTLSDLGLPQVNLPHLRKISREKDYRTYYTSPKQVDKVAKLYEEDLENFNYSFLENLGGVK